LLIYILKTSLTKVGEFSYILISKTFYGVHIARW